MKTHDNQKPFQCTVCNRGYNTAAALTSHMQSHKKQSTLSRNSALNYRYVQVRKFFAQNSILNALFFFVKNSPRSTGSASSSSSLYKRKYSPHIEQRDTPGLNAKRFAYINNTASPLYCIYCTKNDFESLDQLHAHVQQMHAIVLQEVNICLND